MKRDDHGQDSQRFAIVLYHQNRTDFVEINVADMDGWLLYECFYLPSFEPYYFGWDEDAERPEWINMSNEAETENISILSDAIVKYRRFAA